MREHVSSPSLGLALLILIHETGHFFTARAVGMRPRKFYIGFPPAAVKWTRNGIEYGIGHDPVRRLREDPGMHRPAPSDLDVHFGPALYEEPRLLTDVERAKRHVAQGAFDETRGRLGNARPATARAPSSRRTPAAQPTVG